MILKKHIKAQGLDISLCRECAYHLYRIVKVKNPFIIAATVMALAAETKKNDILLGWIFDGRINELEKSQVGLVIKDKLLCVRLLDDMTLSDFLKTIVKKIEMGITYYRKMVY